MKNQPARTDARSAMDYETPPGTLYVVGTPIGNLEDITLRALKILKAVDLIAAERVSHTRSLCRHYGIRKKLVSYNQHNQMPQAGYLMGQLTSGRDVGLVTDAGTPGISDPGVYLIHQAIQHSIRVSPVPGPSAVISALSVAGLPTGKFVFLGFLSSKPGKRKKELVSLQRESRTMVFFESPHRIRAMLTDLKAVLGNRDMVLLREMTKVFEEVRPGPVEEVLGHLDPEKVKGEFTLVVSGAPVHDRPGQFMSERVANRIESLLKTQHYSVRDIAQKVSAEEGLSYRDIYKQCLSIKEHT